MFDLGMGELLVIGVVALIIIGPKDLPEMFRSLGRVTAKMRAMAREFSRAMEAAADESGVKDVARDLKSATSAKSMGLDTVKDAAARFEKWDPLKNAARPSTPTVEPTIATPAMGPATQALAAQQAARKAVAQEAAEKLRQINDPTPAPAPQPKAPRKSRAKAVTPEPDA
jgi:sec-independent protein translocase protein TatB